MKDLKTIADLLHSKVSRTEVTVTDQKNFKRRSKKGYYTRNSDTFDFIYLLRSWSEIVGEFLSKNSLPLRINRKTLYVATKHQIFAQELSFLIPQILEKIHANYPSFKEHIKFIKFVNNEFSVSDINDKTHFSKSEQTQRKKIHPYSPEFLKKKNMANQLFEDIEDEEVKNILISYYLS